MVKCSPAELDGAFGALADPTRRGLVERLTVGPGSVSELARPFDMSLPAVLKHIRVLEAAGLITTVKEGRVRTCSLVPERMRDAEDWIEHYREMWERRLDRLDEVLRERGGKR